MIAQRVRAFSGAVSSFRLLMAGIHRDMLKPSKFSTPSLPGLSVKIQTAQALPHGASFLDWSGPFHYDLPVLAGSSSHPPTMLDPAPRLVARSNSRPALLSWE